MTFGESCGKLEWTACLGASGLVVFLVSMLLLTFLVYVVIVICIILYIVSIPVGMGASAAFNVDLNDEDSFCNWVDETSLMVECAAVGLACIGVIVLGCVVLMISSTIFLALFPMLISLVGGMAAIGGD